MGTNSNGSCYLSNEEENKCHQHNCGKEDEEGNGCVDDDDDKELQALATSDNDKKSPTAACNADEEKPLLSSVTSEAASCTEVFSNDSSSNSNKKMNNTTVNGQHCCQQNDPESNGEKETRQSITKSTSRISAAISNRNGQELLSWSTEVRYLCELAFPTLVIMLGNTIPIFITASYIGRQYGAVYLDGFQLASLTANLFTLSFLQGLYSASDTLSPQAIGAGNYKEAGLVAMRGFLASMIVILPICFVLTFYLQSLLIFLHQDPDASRYASRWYLVYILYIPFYAVYMITWKFLAAQHVMISLVVGTLLSAAIVLPLSMKLFTEWFGFLGTAAALVAFGAAQSFLTLLDVWWFQRYIPETWPGLQLDVWREAIRWEPLSIYFRLGMGGIVAMSEWIYWEAMTLAIGTLGVVPLSVHSITIQVITTTFMAPMSVAIALGIRVAITLPQNVKRAKQLALFTMLWGALFFGFMAWSMYVYQEFIFSLFTSDPDLKQGCRVIWDRVCFYFVHLSIYILFSGIATGLGMQWTLGIVTFLSLWGFGLPAACWFGVHQAGTLKDTWTWYAPPYMLMNGIMFIVFITNDWDAISQEVRLRERMEQKQQPTLLKMNVDTSTTSAGGPEQEKGLSADEENDVLTEATRLLSSSSKSSTAQPSSHTSYS